jgi:hypothetical protein
VIFAKMSFFNKIWKRFGKFDNQKKEKQSKSGLKLKSKKIVANSVCDADLQPNQVKATFYSQSNAHLNELKSNQLNINSFETDVDLPEFEQSVEREDDLTRIKLNPVTRHVSVSRSGRYKQKRRRSAINLANCELSDSTDSQSSEQSAEQSAELVEQSTNYIYSTKINLIGDHVPFEYDLKSLEQDVCQTEIEVLMRPPFSPQIFLKRC